MFKSVFSGFQVFRHTPDMIFCQILIKCANVWVMVKIWDPLFRGKEQFSKNSTELVRHSIPLKPLLNWRWIYIVLGKIMSGGVPGFRNCLQKFSHNSWHIPRYPGTQLPADREIYCSERDWLNNLLLSCYFMAMCLCLQFETYPIPNTDPLMIVRLDHHLI